MRLRRKPLLYEATIYLKGQGKSAKVVYEAVEWHKYVPGGIEFHQWNGNINVMPLDRVGSVRLIREDNLS